MLTLEEFNLTGLLKENFIENINNGVKIIISGENSNSRYSLLNCRIEPGHRFV